VTDMERREIVAQVLEEVAKAANKSKIRANVSPSGEPLNRKEFDRLLRVRAKQIRKPN
jgi:hypothetical protein